MRAVINLKSDTVTLPTDEMRRAMAEAEVGDDVYNADPTVKRLQGMAAERTGMEAALFMPSGSMGNLVALMAHCPAGKEVILEEYSHINYYEGGGMARVAGLMPRTVRGHKGVMQPEDVRAVFRPVDIHFPETGLICVENTHNFAGGTVVPLNVLAGLRAVADERGVPLHMDGARVFNAAAALGVDVREITRHAHSVMFCLSKGLSAPVGSMLCGSAEFIGRALRARKLVGGALRQSGVIAAAGIVALERMVDRLKDDHAHARQLAEGLANVPGIDVDLESVQTNIVSFSVKNFGLNAADFAARLERDHAILCGPKTVDQVRMVVNRHIGPDEVRRTIEAVARLVEK